MLYSVITKIQTGKFQLNFYLLLKDKMVWMMKIFIIFGAHSKIRVLGGEVHEKPIYRGDCLKRGGLVQFEDLRREGGDNPMHTMNMNCCESTGNTIVAETSNNDSVGHDEIMTVSAMTK